MKQKLYPGCKTNRIDDDIYNRKKSEYVKKERERLNLDQDIKIRKYVRRKLEEYVEQGYSREEAAELMMQQKRNCREF